MRYEKKMLILSGEGKGVVLIESGGLGVKFALRTFGLAKTAGLKAGVVTKTHTYIRDLPEVADPSAVFYIDGADVSALHFAVFDTRLLLYGATCEKMWEANLMDILRAKCRPVRRPDPAPTFAPLPPITEKPEKLPLPDGTGIPQSDANIYGDEALASADFYTPFDIESRMKEVDGFLDTPRVLTGLAPTVKPSRLANPSFTHFDASRADAQAETAASVMTSADTPCAQETAETAEALSSVGNDIPVSEMSEAPSADDIPSAGAAADNSQAAAAAPNDTAENEAPSAVDNETPVTATPEAASAGEIAAADAIDFAAPCACGQAAAGKSEVNMADTVETTETAATAETMETAVTAATENAIEAETAATAATAEEAECRDEKPWETEARFLKKRSARVLAACIPKVEKPPESETVPHIRDTVFIERSRGDVDKLFASAPRDGELSKLLPDIEWVKVEFDGHSVSVGRSTAFLCYAVPGKYEKSSPLGTEAQWLPKVASAPTGKGYWLIFQDITTGDIIGCV